MLALTGGTIYLTADADPIRDGVVVIDGEFILSVGTDAPPAGAEILDCAGATVTAGFWNSHVHFFERKWAGAAAIPAPELARQLRETFLRYGFTSVFDLSSDFANTRAIRDAAGLRIRTTGEGLVPPGAVPPEEVLRVMGVVSTPMPEITEAAQAAAHARRLIEQGADGIKLFASTPRGVTLPAGAIAAAAAEAHRAGKPVFVHPNTFDDLTTALREGADVIAHTTPRSGAWPRIDPRGAALTPTLMLWKFFLRHDRASVQDQIVATAVEQLRMWIAAGGAVLFGTDLGAAEPDPRDEYELMSAAGMRFRDILASLTTTTAARFGGSARIAAGAPADITVFEGSDFASVRYTIVNGAPLVSAHPR